MSSRAKSRYRISGTGNACTMILRTGSVTQYWAPHTGGYVYDITDKPGTLGEQVCDGLGSLGSTLRWNPRPGWSLADLIRQEARKASGWIDEMIEYDEAWEATQ